MIFALEIKSKLESIGYNVIAVVPSGDEAYQILLERTPDLILMDIHLEGQVDGVTIVKNFQWSCKVPIIFFSGSVSTEQHDFIQNQPHCHFLGKPFSSDELVRLIESIPS